MEFRELVQKLGFCQEAEARIYAAERTLGGIDDLKPLCAALFGEGAEEGVKALRKALAPDEDGMKMLACMLRCALHSHELYEKEGIPDDIFFSTMGFLSRFVNAHAKTHTAPAFTWDWWFYRQLSLKEFRIGAFEYEMTQREGVPALSLHIPAGADISPQSADDSLRQARAFFSEHFPDYKDADVYCDSWMLSPALGGLLPPASRILAFRDRFEILHWDEESPAALDWIFPRKDLPLQALAEDTSLQKKAKAFLLSGGKIDWALGRLKRT